MENVGGRKEGNVQERERTRGRGIARRKEIAGESLQGSDHRAERVSRPAVNLDVGSVGACE